MKRKKVIALLLCASMAGASLCSCAAVDIAKNSASVEAEEMSDEEMLTKVVTGAVNLGSSEAAKEETVYVKTDAKGEVNSVIVSNWLKNEDKTAELSDVTDLKDIVNVKGKETYSMDGNKLTWETQGEDIYYQGTCDKELPVEVNISYELDGKEVGADELAGKSGHVVVTLNYKNNSANTVLINDKEETIYTPFAAVSAMSLDEEKFTNVKVTNGTVVSDGKRDVVVGMVFPGLIDSLNGGKVTDNSLLETIEEEVNIPDKVVIEADVTDYETGMILTLVTSDISKGLGLDAINLDSNGSITEMKDSLKEFGDAGDELAEGTKKLQDGAQALVGGSSDIAEGSNKLYGGIVEYTNGVGQVASGASSVNDGAGRLDSGIGEIGNGIGTAKNGATALGDGISSVEAGAKQVSEGAATINEKVAELSNGAGELQGGVDALIGQVSELTQGVGSAASAAGLISGGINAVVDATSQATDPSSIDTSGISVTGTVSGEAASAAMLQYITAEQLVGAGFTEEQAQIVLGIVSQVSSQVIPVIVDNATDATAKQVAAQAAANGANEVKSQINAAFTTKDENGNSLQSGASSLAGSLSESYKALSSEEAQNKLTALSVGAASLTNGAQLLSEGTASLSQGASSLYTGTTQLSEGARSLVEGLDKLNSGAQTLKEGSASLKNGCAQLAAGASTLSSNSGALLDGSKSLADGSQLLVNGANGLLDGSIKLNDGMVKFNEEGVKELTDVFETDLGSMKERIQAISDMGKQYKTFSGAAEDEDSTVKFIIESSGVEVKDL